MPDSSKTRVQPVFKKLQANDQTGGTWLRRLILQGSRALGRIGNGDGWPGPLTCPLQFEYEVLSPLDYLTWLVLNPQQIRQQSLDQFTGTTRQKREALILRHDATVQLEALHRLSRSRRPGRGQWHVFEGITKVDCALLTQGAWIFIEGKRTECSLTDQIEWFEDRQQVFRNLDCLRGLVPPREYYVLLVVEENKGCFEQARELDGRYDIARRSWPHLSDDQAKGLFEHYIGCTTWQRIAQEFELQLDP